MISPAALLSTEAFAASEAGVDYFASETHYLSLAGRIIEVLRGSGRFFLVIGEPPPNAHLLSLAFGKSTPSSDAVISLRCGPELVGDEIRRAASVITRLPAGGAGQVSEPSGLAAPLFVFDDMDRLSDGQIRDIYEAAEHGDRIGAAGVLLARPVFLSRLDEPALHFLKEAVAGQFHFQEVGQDERIEFLRHQLATRHRSPEIRRISHRIVQGYAAFAGLAAAIAAILVLHRAEPAGERSAHPTTEIASTGPTAAPSAALNGVTRAPPAEAAPMAEPAAVRQRALPVAPTVPPAPTPQAQSDPALPAAMKPAPPPEESPSLAPAQPLATPAAPPRSTESAAGPVISPAEIAVLVARGDGFLSSGDIASARLFYERAAAAGDGPAALRLGATFDPGFLERTGIRGVQGDADQAASWYRRARELDQRSLTEPGPPAR